MRRASAKTRLLFPELALGRDNPWFSSPLLTSQRQKKICGLLTLELCAGAGGQSLGLEQAGIEHAGLLEINEHACETLRINRPTWRVVQEDLRTFDARPFRGVDIVSGGLPCPPFSIAGKQLGQKDDRNLFPSMIRVVDEVRPKAVMIENVRGFLDAVFEDYRQYIASQLKKLGYITGWKLLSASDYGAPQLRPRVVFVAIKREHSQRFYWPEGEQESPKTVGQTLLDLMASNGWKGAKAWSERADEIAPTIVGGSLKHGGPDLGPTRARKAWANLGVDGIGIANEPPPPNFVGMPRLTVRMVARLQGFPDSWRFAGTKTQSYRQVGNAFPPPVARAVAQSLRVCLEKSHRRSAIAV